MLETLSLSERCAHFSCPCGRGDYGLCVNCPYPTCTAHDAIFFLDIDGPLNPFENKPSRRPDGYQTFRWRVPPSVKPDGRRDNGKRRVWLRPEHGPDLLKLPVRLVWATAWGHSANELIGPHLGLPELPVATPVNRYGRRGRFQSWKTPELLEYAAGRPFAWADDEIYANDVGFLTANATSDVFLLPVSPRRGLQSADFEAVRRWAERVAAVAVPGVAVAQHAEKLVLKPKVLYDCSIRNERRKTLEIENYGSGRGSSYGKNSSPSMVTSPDHGPRASNADRTRYADYINSAYADGYLDDEEREMLLNSILAARYQSALTRIVRDASLPSVPEPEPVLAAESSAYQKAVEAWHRKTTVVYLRFTAGVAASVMLAAGVPTADSDVFDGFANGGALILLLNVFSIAFGIIAAIGLLVTWGIWDDGNVKPSKPASCVCSGCGKKNWW
jgi:Domain of unknown function (DUF1707)